MGHEAENIPYLTLSGKSAEPCMDRLTLGCSFTLLWWAFAGRVPGFGAVIEEATVRKRARACFGVSKCKCFVVYTQR